MSDTNMPLIGEIDPSTGDVQSLRDMMRTLEVKEYLALKDGVTFQFRFKPGPPAITYKFPPGSEIYRIESLVSNVRRYIVWSNDRDYLIRIDESVQGLEGDFWFMGTRKPQT